VGEILGPAIAEKEPLFPIVIAAHEGVLNTSMNDAPLPTRGEGLGRGCGASVLTPIPLSACGEGANLCQAVRDPRKAREYEPRVKVIGPRLMTAATVSPGAIRALSSNNIACRAHGPVTEADFTR